MPELLYLMDAVNRPGRSAPAAPKQQPTPGPTFIATRRKARPEP